MNSTRLRSCRNVGTLLFAGTLVLAAGCATAPEPGRQPAPDQPAAAASCAELLAEIARTEQARSVAAEQSSNAWKAVVPVIVLAQKASGTAAVHDADRKLVALKDQAGRCQTS